MTQYSIGDGHGVTIFALDTPRHGATLRHSTFGPALIVRIAVAHPPRSSFAPVLPPTSTAWLPAGENLPLAGALLILVAARSHPPLRHWLFPARLLSPPTFLGVMRSRFSLVAGPSPRLSRRSPMLVGDVLLRRLPVAHGAGGRAASQTAGSTTFVVFDVRRLMRSTGGGARTGRRQCLGRRAHIGLLPCLVNGTF